MRKILTSLMIVCMVFLQVPASAFAAEESTGQTCTDTHNFMMGVCADCGYVCEHAWNTEDIEFGWSEGCTAYSICTICNSELEQECTVTTERTEPTCTTEGQVVSTAVVVIDGIEYTDMVTSSIDSIDHQYEDDVCIYCGDTIITLDTPVLKAVYSASGIKVSWKEVDKATGYELYRKSGLDWELVKELSASTLSYTDKNLVHGASYAYRLKAVVVESDKTFESDYSVTVEKTTNVIYAPKTVKATRAGYKSITVSWSRVYPATGYEIYRSETGKTGSFVKVKTIEKASTLSWKNTGLTTGQKYYYKVRAIYRYDVTYAKKGNLSSAKSATPNLSQPVMKKTAYATGSTIKVSWNKVSYANGYYVYQKKVGGTWKKVGTVKGNSTFSYKDKTSAGVYLYSVKAYRTVNGKNVLGERSESIKVRTLKAPTVTVTNPEDEFKNIVTWTKVTGATGYQLWQKVEGGSWKLVSTKSSSETRKVIVSVDHGKEVKWKVRAIYKKDGITTYGGYSKIKPYIVSYAPYYGVTVPSGSKSSMRYITLTITNMGNCKMKILKAGGIYNPEEDQSQAKETVLVNSSTNKTMNSLTIAPGETKKVKFKVVGNTTEYNQEYFVGFTFHYDGVDYVGVSSAYYGNYYQEVEL